MEQTTVKIITPSKGICNAIPDIICDDSELQDCIGLTYHDEALRPIQDTVEKLTVDGQLLFVHELNTGDKHYIYYKDNQLYWTDQTDTGKIGSTLKGVTQVKSIGNTLIVNTANGIYYYLWRTSKYISLGNKIPEPFVQVSFKRNTTSRNINIGVYGICVAKEASKSSEHANQVWASTDNQSDFENAIVGGYAKLKNLMTENNEFVNPFFLRYAVELYDGSYTLISNPILMYTYFGDDLTWMVTKYKDDGDWWPENVSIKMNGLSLIVSQYTDYSDYSDVVKGVTLFITSPVDRYRSDHEDITEEVKDGVGYKIWSSFEQQEITESQYFDAEKNKYSITPPDVDLHFYYYLLSHKTNADIIKELKSSSVFYKLCDIGKKTIYNVDASKFFPRNVLENISTQTQLPHDDYYGHTTLYPSNTYTFNRRLNLTGINRSFFNGFELFSNLQWKYRQRTVYVRIKAPTGDRIVNTSFTYSDPIENGSWFFYPDTRADYFWVYNGSTFLFGHSLTEHPSLNGAYYYENMPYILRGELVLDSPKSGSESFEDVYTEAEPLQNYLLQSEVDNPFTFNASGYVRVGQGTIIGIAALTTALNQDAYKVATTLVFTTQGIWALKINDEGQYTSVAPPFSREVCVNADTITMVDNGVFFVSKKGLMLITDDGIQCVSQQLNGKNNTTDFGSFIDFARNCIMAYDYRDSQLWLTNSNYDYHWVYNMKTGTFSRKIDGKNYTSIVTDYPDTLCQSTDYKVYSMLTEPNINDDTTVYGCSYTTRPMKFEASLQMKSIRQILHMMDLNDSATIKLTMEVSNDCKHWATQNSVGGRGYKYFRFKYTFTGLKATDTFCASAITYTTSENDKIR